MSTFDPTKPCRYRFGEEPLAVFVLPTPQTGGETIVSVRRTGLSHTHHPSGRLACSGLSNLDLINIPEKRTISVWAVIDAYGDVLMVCKEKPCDPMFAAAGRKVVELTKEVEL